MRYGHPRKEQAMSSELETVSKIEDAIAQNKMGAPEVFTQMRQLLDRQASRITELEALKIEAAKLADDYMKLNCECAGLRERVAELEGMVPRWIAVGERLPGPLSPVNVFCPRSPYEKVYSAHYGQGVFHTGDDVVTHWQPLPSTKGLDHEA
jgi:hypothetical protein